MSSEIYKNFIFATCTITTIYHFTHFRKNLNLPGFYNFVTFIDDFSRYSYMYFIHEKSEVLNVFKIYKAKVENHLN